MWCKVIDHKVYALLHNPVSMFIMCLLLFTIQLRANKNALDDSSEEIGVGLVEGKIDLPQFISVSNIIW